MRYKFYKIIRSKLGRSKIWGYADSDGEVCIDQRLKGKKELEIIIHEVCHQLWPVSEEPEIEGNAAVLARTLWREGYRKVDLHDKDKLQDEKK